MIRFLGDVSSSLSMVVVPSIHMTTPLEYLFLRYQLFLNFEDFLYTFWQLIRFIEVSEFLFFFCIVWHKIEIEEEKGLEYSRYIHSLFCVWTLLWGSLQKPFDFHLIVFQNKSGQNSLPRANVGFETRFFYIFS